MNSYQETNNSLEQSEFQQNLAILREISFFSEFPLELLKIFAYLCTREVYSNNDIIFDQGDDDGRAYYILSGEAVLTRKHEENEVLIRTCGENSFFGAFTLANNVSRLFALRSSTETCCLVVSREAFQEAITQFPDARQYIIKGLIDNVITWEKKFLKDNINCESCLQTMGVSII